MMKMALYLCGLPLKTLNHSVIMKKKKTNSNTVTSYKIPNEYSSKLSKSSRTRKVSETITT